jgi:hypothetical protein
MKCLVCGYQAALKVDATPLQHFRVKPAGFQKWLTRIFAYGDSAAAALRAMHALFGIILLILVIMSLVSSGLGQILIMATTVGAAALYAYLVFDLRRIARQPAARLSFWQSFGWQGLLLVLRLSNWRLATGGTPYKVLDLKRKNISPQQFLGTPNLSDYEVIDLEGVPLTDATLARLHGLRRLRRLVLRRTGVSAEAVFRLQQALPDAWIWS